MFSLLDPRLSISFPGDTFIGNPLDSDIHRRSTQKAGINVKIVSFGQPLWIQWIRGSSPVNLSVWSTDTIADQPGILVCELVGM